MNTTVITKTREKVDSKPKKRAPVKKLVKAKQKNFNWLGMGIVLAGIVALTFMFSPNATNKSAQTQSSNFATSVVGK